MNLKQQQTNLFITCCLPSPPSSTHKIAKHQHWSNRHRPHGDKHQDSDSQPRNFNWIVTQYNRHWWRNCHQRNCRQWSCRHKNFRYGGCCHVNLINNIAVIILWRSNTLVVMLYTFYPPMNDKSLPIRYISLKKLL